PNSLIIVLGTVQFYLSENGGTLDFSSLHNQHVATDIMQVFHVKEGIVLKNKEQGKYVPPTPPERDGTDWEVEVRFFFVSYLTSTTGTRIRERYISLRADLHCVFVHHFACLFFY